MNKVALVVNSFPKTSETFILNKIIELAKRGFQITVFTHSKSNEALNLDASFSKNVEIREIFGRVKKIKYTIRGLFLFNKKLPVLINKNRNFLSSSFRLGVLAEMGEYPIVHFEFSGLAVNYFPELKVLHPHTKVIVSCRGSAELIVPILDPERKKQLIETLNKINLVHCVSENIHSNLVGFGLKNEKIKVIRPAINKELFDFKPLTRNATEPLRIIVVGRLDWVKGYDLAISAISKLIAAGNKIEFSIIGSGSEENKLKFITSILGIQNFVSFLGSLNPNQVRLELQRNHILISSSWSEGISNSVLEAKFSGVAVISTMAGGMNEVIIHEKTGYLVELGDVNGIKKGIEFYLNDKIRLKIIENAREEVIINHSLGNQINDIENLYFSL